ncbi:unnamed protein product [Cylicocyclus nassatus]|uniref:Major facilitator superfamily (MFS) profile domain-containing protein n=1 Tax=Cylicocyclus nassatus TaxID=53992 RepID=A0AA36MFB6_CYLNA|nr:unnamed protein product [Cylicocyclus nassatus]
MCGYSILNEVNLEITPEMLIGIDYYNERLDTSPPPARLPSGLYAVPTIFGYAITGIDNPVPADELMSFHSCVTSMSTIDNWPDTSSTWTLESLGKTDPISENDENLAILQQFCETIEIRNKQIFVRTLPEHEIGSDSDSDTNSQKNMDMETQNQVEEQPKEKKEPTGAAVCSTSAAATVRNLVTQMTQELEKIRKEVENKETTVNRYDYSPAEKSSIIWAVAVGTILGTFPINYYYIKFGARWPFFISGLLSVCSTAAIPLAAHFGLPYLLLSRFIQGLAYAADFAAIGILCVRWAPLSQTCIFISVLTTFTPVSTVVTNPLSGWLCDSNLGWRSAYYMHAVFGLFVFILWIIFYRDDPQLHPSVSAKELSEIQKDKTQAHIERDSFVPYKEIIKNRVILIVWFNAFTEMTTVTLLLVYAPIYFHNVLGYDIPTTGVLVSFAASIHLPLKFVGGIISDRITSVTERHKMWFFNSIAVGLAGVFCALIGVFPANWSKTGVALFTLVITCMGMNPGGFYKCGTLSSRQYAHFVLATIQFMKCIALFVGPAMVAMIVHDERRHDQWRHVYWINGILLILANFIFIPIATDQPASFTLITRATRDKNRLKSNTEINGLEMCGKTAKNGDSASLRPTIIVTGSDD